MSRHLKPLINYSGSVPELIETMSAWKASGITHCTITEIADTFGMSLDEVVILLREAMDTGKVIMEAVGGREQYRKATSREVKLFRQYRGDPAEAPPETVVAVMRKLGDVLEDSIAAVCEQVARRYEGDMK